MLQDLAEEYKFQVPAMEAMPDHIHLLAYIEGQKEKEKKKSLTEGMIYLLEKKRCRQYLVQRKLNNCYISFWDNVW